MDRKIGILASDIGLKETISKLYSDDIKLGKIIIDILDSEKLEEQGKLLENMGAKAIIARSGGYRHTIGKVSVPVIHLKISTLDILHAIKTASKIKKDVVLLISDLEYFDYDEWKELFNCNVLIEKFNSNGEIEDIVSNYASKQSTVIVVGGGIPCKLAQKYNLDYFYIGASDDSIHQAISQAWELVDSLYEQKYKNEVLKTTLDEVHDAVVAVDMEDKIIFYNERAKELLKKDRESVMDKKLLEVFPELSIMKDVLKSKINIYNEIINLKRNVVAANASLLEVDSQVIGVLCSFQDITKLQSLEKKIRYELNKKGLIAKYKFEDIINNDPVTKSTLAKAIKIGSSDSTAMIYGESGTGKEMIAQSIHNISDRKDEPFVAVNCAAISENLLESELFGYEEGAFTGARKGGKPGLFELAHRGTIFLDEINSMTLNLQAKLLRVLEEKEVMRIGSDYVIPLDTRILAAANEGLKSKIEDGSFRKDLFYRLNIIELHIPPLRAREKDIIPIFKYYLSKFSETYEVPIINSQLENKLMGYSWPGNVRELRNIAQRYIMFGDVDLDGSNDINVENKRNINEEQAEEKYNDIQINSDTVLDIKEINKFVEIKVIDMLEGQGMSKNNIAKVLGISRSSLWNKLNSNNEMYKK